MNANSTCRSLPYHLTWVLGTVRQPNKLSFSSSRAVVWEHGERTYAELRSRALHLAQWLRSQGLKSGDRVVTLLFNRGEIFDIYFACAYAGLTLVPINFRLHPSEVAEILGDSTPKVAFTEEELAPVLQEAARGVEGSLKTVTLLPEESGPEYVELSTKTGEIPEQHSTDTHLILYTSGTTGVPKGVMLSHANIAAFALQQAIEFTRFDARSVTLLTGPMYNQAAINEQSIPTFFVGGTVTVMPSRGWTPGRMIDFIDRWGVTHAIIYPSMINPLLQEHDERERSLETLKYVLSGGENCPPALMRKMLETWPHVDFCVAYGSTESGLVSGLIGQDILDHVGSVGHAPTSQTFYIGDAEGRSLDVGDTGEIWVSGPSVSSGYWNAPGLTASAFRDGWHRMGDLGKVDEAGRLHLSGRSKDMVISKGQNVYPVEIENVLIQHPAIREVTVVGVPDEEFGEAVCAVVVVKDGFTITETEVVDFTKLHIASFKKPRYVVFSDSLPRNPAQKVLKDEVVEFARRKIENE